MLGIVLLLVVGISRFFLNGSDAADDTAAPVADEPTATVTVTPTPSAKPSKEAGSAGKPKKPKSSAPPEPTGECSPSDIVVEPAVSDGYSYDNVTIPLQLKDPYGLAILACIITATPGTIWMSYRPADGQLLIHVFDLIDETEWVRTVTQRYEAPLREIFE